MKCQDKIKLVSCMSFLNIRCVKNLPYKKSLFIHFITSTFDFFQKLNINLNLCCSKTISHNYILNFQDIFFNISMQTKFNYDPKWQTVQYTVPKKYIVALEDVQVFQKTSIYAELTTFLIDLQTSVRSKKITDTQPLEKFYIFQQYFKHLQKLLEQTPPIKQPMRFGNKAFKDWLKKVQQYTSSFLDKLLPQKIYGAKDQLFRYIIQSYGSNVRIDYGTGHQLSFMFFCWSLNKLGYYQKSQYQQMVRQVFYSYINTMRKIQILYNLQPAGSHGVWGLDDYHFLPFLIGASQLIDNEQMPLPQSIRNDPLVNAHYKVYMYINCVKFIKQQKKGIPFQESSPILDNISGAASWLKVTNGMIKMYQVEVLGKHPVIKHAYFGTIISFK